jgi:hypothetical protein
VAALITIRHPEQLVLDVPPDCYDRVGQCLDLGFAALNELRSLWQKHRHDASVGLRQPRASQRVRQSTKEKTRRKTKRSQTVLILTALRTAEQPLTHEHLQQVPGVDGGMLPRYLRLLVEQRKILETPTGYVAASTEDSQGSSGSDASHEAVVTHPGDGDTVVNAMSQA